MFEPLRFDCNNSGHLILAQASRSLAESLETIVDCIKGRALDKRSIQTDIFFILNINIHCKYPFLEVHM